MKASHVIAVVSAAVLMLAGLAVLPATVIIVPLLSVGSGALDDNSGGGGGSVGGDACVGTVTGGTVGAGGLTARQKQLVTTIVTVAVSYTHLTLPTTPYV